MLQSPNYRIARMLLLINLPLSAVGVMGFIYLLYCLMGIASPFFDFLGLTISTGFGLWLQYLYYVVSQNDFDPIKERSIWKLSIGYNALAIVCLIGGIISSLDLKISMEIFLVLLYPISFLGLSIKALINLNRSSNFTTPQLEP